MEKLNFEELKESAYKAAVEKTNLEEQSENFMLVLSKSSKELI